MSHGESSFLLQTPHNVPIEQNLSNRKQQSKLLIPTQVGFIFLTEFLKIRLREKGSVLPECKSNEKACDAGL